MRVIPLLKGPLLERLLMKALLVLHNRRCLLLIMIVPILVFLQIGQAVELRQNGAQVQVTPEMLKSKIDALSQNSQLDETTRGKLLELYRKGFDNLNTIQANNAQADTFVDTISNSLAEIQKLRQTIKRLTLKEEQNDQHSGTEEAETRPLNDLEQELLQAKVNAAELEVKVNSLTRQSNLLNDRPSKISQRLSEIKKSEDVIVETLHKLSSQNTVSTEQAEAQNLLYQTQLAALQSESRMLNQELVGMPVTIELLNLQRDEASSRLELAQQKVQTLVDKVNRKRQQEAAQSVDKANAMVARVAGNHPLLQQVAQDIAAYSEQLLTLSTVMEATAAERSKLDQELKRIEENFETTRQKVEMAGMSQAQGLLLHDMQRNLPSTRLLIRQLNHNHKVLAEAGLAQVRVEEERKKQEDIKDYIKKLTGNTTAETAKGMRPELRILLTSRGDLLDKIIAANRSYLGQLSEIEFLTNTLLNTVEQFDRFLGEHLLWTRSTPVLNWKDVTLLPGELRPLLAPGDNGLRWVASSCSRSFFRHSFSWRYCVAAACLWLVDH